MLNIPEYKHYNGERRIALLDNSAVSFMEKLDVFEEITEKGYSEQVHTSDISENRKEALTQTKEWLETAQGQKLRKKTEDGYELAPDMHSHRTRHRRTISVRSHVFLADHSL